MSAVFQIGAIFLLCLQTDSFSNNYVANSKVDKQIFKLPIMDISPECNGEFESNIYLPIGSGITESRQILVTNMIPHSKKCKINVFPSLYKRQNISIGMIGVIELYNYEIYNSTCQDGDILIKSGNRIIDVCQNMKKRMICSKDAIYWNLFTDGKLTFILNFSKFSGVIKFTITLARNIDQSENCEEAKEVICKLPQNSVCINRIFLCDEIINCGYPNSHDEDFTKCAKEKIRNLWAMLLYGFAIFLFLIFFLTQILKLNVPTIARNFFVVSDAEENNTLLVSSQSRPPPNFDISSSSIKSEESVSLESLQEDAEKKKLDINTLTAVSIR